MNKYSIGDMFLFDDGTYFVVGTINEKGEYLLVGSLPNSMDDEYWTQDEIDRIILVPSFYEKPTTYVPNSSIGKILYGQKKK